MSRLALHTVGRLARDSGISVRTLHHYDEIGLLHPAARSHGGRRLYDRDDVLRLQQILTYRALGLPLEEIRNLLDEPGLDRRSVLLSQRAAVERQIAQSEALLRGIDAALSLIDEHELKEMDMTTLFGGFDPAQFEEEAKSRWGQTQAWAESQRRTKRYSKEDWKRYQEEHREICEKLASLMRDGTSVGDPVTQRVAAEYAALIDRWFYPCDSAHLGRLAEMYESDVRFRKTFDLHAEGLSSFIMRAFRAHAEPQR